MADIFEIAGRIHSTSQEEVVTTTSEILAGADNKKQSDVNTEVQTALDDRYTKEQTYNKQELDNLITTPDVTYETYRATDETSVDDILPAEGAADTIYRIGNWDGTTEDATKFAEYSWNGSNYVLLRVVDSIGDGVFDISEYNASGGTLAEYDDLADALGTNGANVPEGVRNGGMSVKFVQTSDNKYVQFRYMSSDAATDATFTNVANWQGVDDEPTAGSKNLVTSGGVQEDIARVDGGVFKSATIQVTQGTAKTTNDTLTLYVGTKIRVHVVPTPVIGGTVSLSLYYGAGSSDRDILQLPQNGDYVDYEVTQQIIKCGYYVGSSAAAQTGDCTIEFKYPEKYATIDYVDDQISDVSSSVTEVAGDVTALQGIANGVTQTPSIDSDKNIAKSSGIVTDLIDRIGGSFLSDPIPVTQGVDFAVSREVLIKAGTNIKFRLVQTDLVTTHINFYVYYEGYTSDADRKLVSLTNDGVYKTISDPENKDIVKVLYNNAASRNIGTGNIFVEYYAGEKYATKQELEDSETQLSSDIASMQSSISGIETDISAKSPATTDPGNISEYQIINCLTDNYKHLTISVLPGQNIKIEAGTLITDYVILKTLPDLSQSTSPRLDFAGTQTVRTRITANTSEEFTIPSDGHWLLTSCMYNGNTNYKPKSVTSDGKDLITGYPSLDDRVEDLDERVTVLEQQVTPPKSFLKYTKSVSANGLSNQTHPRFEFYQYNGNGKYFKLVLELCIHLNTYPYEYQEETINLDWWQYLWRITGGECYNADNLSTSIGHILDTGENEWACAMTAFRGFESHVGGYHGGERIDLDTENCFVRFLADGKLLNITSETEDFTLECNTFQYIQKAALYMVNTNTQPYEVIADHPKYAYHTKIVNFENCGYNVENIFEMIPNLTLPYSVVSTQYYSLLSCIGKGCATSVLIPNSILEEGLSGSTNFINSDNTKNSRAVFWNTTTNLGAEAESELIQGIDDTTVDVFKIWDRATDSKYYRYKHSPSVDLESIGVVISTASVRFK